MPMYDYCCDDCGTFRLLRPMAESQWRQPCPDCGAPAERLLCAPFLSGGPAEPTPPAGFRLGQGRMPWRHVCGSGCTQHAA